MVKRSVVILAAASLFAGPVVAEARTSAVAGLKTAGACNDEYKANKGALKDAKERKKDFIAACRALPTGSPTPIGTASSAPATPAALATAPASRAAAPSAPPPAAAPSPRRTASAAPGESACANGYANLPASHPAAQFCEEAQAKARCPGQPVVWVNTASKVFHIAGSNTYGHTKKGAYMCEADATAEGDRPSKNGH